MDIKLKFLSVAILLFTLWTSWFFRYDLEVGGEKTFGYVLDRWTGEIEIVIGVKRRPTTLQ